MHLSFFFFVLKLPIKRPSIFSRLFVGGVLLSNSFGAPIHTSLWNCGLILSCYNCIHCIKILNPINLCKLINLHERFHFDGPIFFLHWSKNKILLSRQQILLVRSVFSPVSSPLIGELVTQMMIDR